MIITKLPLSSQPQQDAPPVSRLGMEQMGNYVFLIGNFDQASAGQARHGAHLFPPRGDVALCILLGAG